MKSFVCLLALVGAAASQALTFQFLLRSTRLNEVYTQYMKVTSRDSEGFVAVGRAGDDLLVHRWDKFGNILQELTYDGPNLDRETPIDVAIDDLDAVWVLYTPQAGNARLVRFDYLDRVVFDAEALNTIGEVPQKLVVNAAREGYVTARSAAFTDTTVVKFSGAGALRWRQNALGFRYRDADLEPGGAGLLVVGRDDAAQQAAYATFRTTDGVRINTYTGTDTVDAGNGFWKVATTRSNSLAYAMATVITGSGRKVKLFKIANSGAPITALSTADPLDNAVDVAVSETNPPKVAYALYPPNGTSTNVFLVNENLVAVGNRTIEDHRSTAISMDPVGSSIFVAGTSYLSQNTIDQGPPLVRMNTDSQLSPDWYYEPLLTNSAIRDCVAIDLNTGIAVGEDNTQLPYRGVAIRLQGPWDWRVTSLVTQHPTRNLVDSATDPAGNSYQLIALGTLSQRSLVVKRAPTGEELYQVLLPDGAGRFYGQQIAIGPNGMPIVAGHNGSQGSTGVWSVMQLNPATGATNWTRSLNFGTNRTGSIADLAVNAANEILMTGPFQQVSGFTNMATARLFADGSIRWTRLYSTTAGEDPRQCLFLPGGQVVITYRSGPTDPKALVYSATGSLLRILSFLGDEALSGYSASVQTDGKVWFATSILLNGAYETNYTLTDPLTGTLYADINEPLTREAKIAASPDGKPWVARKNGVGTFIVSRIDGTSFVATTSAPANTDAIPSLAVHSDNTLVYIGTTLNPTTQARASYIARHLTTGGRSALRNFAGTVKTLAKSSEPGFWATGDLPVRNAGTEIFSAKYTLP